MSNQMIINFAHKHIEELQQELKDWEHILEVYEEEDMCGECNNEMNDLNTHNHINPGTLLCYTHTHA